jgi:hypothetical protein
MASWVAAREWLCFAPLEPAHGAGCELQSLSLFVPDHRQRKLAKADRSLEAHYGDFVVIQSWRGPTERRRWALEVSYGVDSREVRIGGHSRCRYELGSKVPTKDPKGPSAAVVVWHDGELLLLVASAKLGACSLVDVAQSMYGRSGVGRRGLSQRDLNFGVFCAREEWGVYRVAHQRILEILVEPFLRGTPNMTIPN